MKKPKQTVHNINEMATVTLTEDGIKIIKEECPYQLASKRFNKKTNEFTTELWDLMAIFGPVSYVGGKLHFVNNEISFKGV